MPFTENVTNVKIRFIHSIHVWASIVVVCVCKIIAIVNNFQ